MPNRPDRHPPARYAARFALIAPMAAVVLGCLAGPAVASRSETDAGWWLNLVVGTVMSGLVVAGLALAVVAYILGKKTQATETVQLALLGLALNVLYLLLYLAGIVYWLTLPSGGA